METYILDVRNDSESVEPKTESVEITTELCKQAIIDYVAAHPGHVEAQFGSPSLGEPAFDEAPAKKASNWKRESKRMLSAYEQKEVPGAKTVRTFNCKHYDDQLRAYVYDDGLKIVHIEIIGKENDMEKYIFDVRDMPEGVVVAVTTESDWEKNNCMTDEHLEELNDLMSRNGFNELMENTWESPFSVEDSRTKLISLGFKESELPQPKG